MRPKLIVQTTPDKIIRGQMLAVQAYIFDPTTGRTSGPMGGSGMTPGAGRYSGMRRSVSADAPRTAPVRSVAGCDATNASNSGRLIRAMPLIAAMRSRSTRAATARSVMDSTSALELPEIPSRLLVIGGGYIGLEMGTVYAALGTRVTVVEMLDGLLAGADPDLVAPLAARLAQQFEARFGGDVSRIRVNARANHVSHHDRNRHAQAERA